APVDGEPLVLARCLLVVLRHPSHEVNFGLQYRHRAGFIEQQELFGLDAHATPAERACIAELGAVAMLPRATEQALKLVGAEGDEDRGQLGGVEVAEADCEAELAARF